MDCWVVTYAKILIHKDTGIVLQGVYYGGSSNTEEVAESIARECVNSIKGGTIIPKIYRLDGDFDLVSALYCAAEKFEKDVNRMIEVDNIISKK
jgi:hypothetical protein